MVTPDDKRTQAAVETLLDHQSKISYAGSGANSGLEKEIAPSNFGMALTPGNPTIPRLGCTAGSPVRLGTGRTFKRWKKDIDRNPGYYARLKLKI